MAQRLYNFSAGPAMMPTEVLEASAQALLDYQSKGFGIAEVSHRGSAFNAVREEAERRCRELLGIGDDYAVLFLQGGATQQFELLAMNFLHRHADYVVSGQWAKKAAQAAERHGRVAVVASSDDVDYSALPRGWQASDDADYLHICSNNTIFGTRWSEFPAHPCLIADMSSEIMSRVIDVSRFGMIYAGAQKNLGPAGVALVIARRELLASRRQNLPPIFDYQAHADADSCLNTPPTFGIFVLLETFRWLERQGGIAGIEERNAEKARLLYRAIDESAFYTGTVSEPADRSHMNVTFTLPDEERTATFLAEAEAQGLLALKGYRSVGGVRASIYNAMPVAGVEALVAHMRDFEAANG